MQSTCSRGPVDTGWPVWTVAKALDFSQCQYISIQSGAEPSVARYLESGENAIERNSFARMSVVVNILRLRSDCNHDTTGLIYA